MEDAEFFFLVGNIVCCLIRISSELITVIQIVKCLQFGLQTFLFCVWGTNLRP